MRLPAVVDDIRRIGRWYYRRARDYAAPPKSPKPIIEELGVAVPGALSGKLREAFRAGLAGSHRVDPSLLRVVGMSGRKYRATINGLIGSLPDARYLEIGVWAGSTLCAALYGNAVTALAIDNWSLFGGPVAQFFQNVSRFRGTKARLSFLEQDFRSVDYTTVGRHNVYLFDGPHEEQDHFDAITCTQPALDEAFILIVDDWNFAEVRAGTERGMKEVGLEIEYAVVLRTTLDGSHTPLGGERSDWHNGYFLAAVKKPRPG